MIAPKAFKTEGQSLRITFSKGGWSLRGAFYPEGQSIRGVFYPVGQSLRGAFYPAGQSLRLTSPLQKSFRLLIMFFCCFVKSVINKSQSSMYLLTWNVT